MEKFVPVSMSNRHVHLSKKDLEALFGEGYELTVMKELSQPGQYACEEKVDVVGPKGALKGVRILGPVRPSTQVEISKFDARAMGVEGVVRASGNTAGTPGCILVGPKGQVELKEGVIVAARHIHMHTSDASKFGLKDKDVVKVRVGNERAVVFENVVVRVHPEYALDMHIDIEEGNAAGINNGDLGEIIRE
ncbi:phosphate propanoyltransferase [Lutispora thermophila]|uniref:Phosphate propanoyltransferase n=1 Tax=Lutispora thermophila DSM 19022 TaxID=1122184 RepID=A0A1M6EXM7_9FIRM|nr:phosphate propanoyltransferase [Lutispora thermophila]SHI90185.1 putative phosphotransacetylase [Lutispora thermophila DSM 19022]